MAERVVVTCDECGNAPADTIGINARGKSYSKDLCATHLAALLKGSRAPRRGRPRKAEPSAAAVAAPTRQGRPPKNLAASAGPAVASAARAKEAKRPRKKITDPVVLEKLRANMAKAREARARKGASVVTSG